MGVTYDSSRQRGAPPSADYGHAGAGFVTIQAPADPPQPKPRKKIPLRPSSMVESGRSDALSVAPEGHRHSRGDY